MFLDQMDLVERADFINQNPEVRILAVPKDDEFRHDLDEPIADYKVDFSDWEKEFQFQLRRNRNRKVNVICIAILCGNGEYLGYEKIRKKAKTTNEVKL